MLKILSIGNSFSQDATAFLHQIAKANNFDLLTVNLYIGGCSLKQHWQNLTLDSQAYELEINGVQTKELISIKDALAKENWDYITLQQVSSQSMDYNTYQPYLARLVNAIEKARPLSEIVLHQTWAYEDGSEKLQRTGFSTHKSMFHGLDAAYEKAAKAHNCKVIPAGFTFHGFTEQEVGPLYRDSYHASIPFGRFVLAAVWFEFFSKRKPQNTDFCPGELTEAELRFIHEQVAILRRSFKNSKEGTCKKGRQQPVAVVR